MADLFQYVMTEWIPDLLGDGFEDWRRCKPCGLPLLPEDQVRVLGYQATLRFHCAMTALNVDVGTLRGSVRAAANLSTTPTEASRLFQIV